MSSAPHIRSTSGFMTSLVVEAVDDQHWQLVHPLRWHGSQGDLIIVEAGEVTDFASTPQLTQILFPRTGAWTKAAVVHDMLCRELNEAHESMLEEWRSNPDLTWKDLLWLYGPTFNAVDTDAVFEKIMLEEGVPRWKASVMWAGVRVGAAANPARRQGWWSTFPRFARIAGAVLLTVLAAAVGIHEIVELVLPW